MFAPTMGDFLAKWCNQSPGPDPYAGIKEMCSLLGIDGESCPACRIKASVLARQFPDDTHVAWLNMMLNRAGA